ncbi:hypothetical protein LEP1GSC074_3100 [Leptospira noguchii str. Hook]|nr:hypothetical protein LEP1GSC074_3100 [Leptospira noguchii str. Hook]
MYFFKEVFYFFGLRRHDLKYYLNVIIRIFIEFAFDKDTYLFLILAEI